MNYSFCDVCVEAQHNTRGFTTGQPPVSVVQCLSSGWCVRHKSRSAHPRMCCRAKS